MLSAPVEGVTHRRDSRAVERHQATRAFIETLRTNRDPCPLCAVRGDIGCKHSRRFS